LQAEPSAIHLYSRGTVHSECNNFELALKGRAVRPIILVLTLSDSIILVVLPASKVDIFCIY
jgi:hypothetical protein